MKGTGPEELRRENDFEWDSSAFLFYKKYNINILNKEDCETSTGQLLNSGYIWEQGR